MISKNLITKIRRRGCCTTRRKDPRVRVVELSRLPTSRVVVVLSRLLLLFFISSFFVSIVQQNWRSVWNGAKNRALGEFLFCFLLKKSSVLSSRVESDEEDPHSKDAKKSQFKHDGQITIKDGTF